MGDAQRVAHRNQIGRSLGCHDPGHARCGKDIALGYFLFLDQLDSRFAKTNLALGASLSRLAPLCGDVDHARLPARVDVTELIHRRAETSVFHSPTAARICSAAESLG